MGPAQGDAGTKVKHSSSEVHELITAGYVYMCTYMYVMNSNVLLCVSNIAVLLLYSVLKPVMMI